MNRDTTPSHQDKCSQYYDPSSNRKRSNINTTRSYSIRLLLCMIICLGLGLGVSAFTQNQLTVQRAKEVDNASSKQWFKLPPTTQSSPSSSIFPPNPPSFTQMVATSELERSSIEGESDGENDEDSSVGVMPELGKDGIYHIVNGDQHKALLEANPDKLVVLKVFAPWCRACKGLEPKFNAIVKDEKYANVPIIWADLTIQHNKDFVKSLGVLALPSVQFYVHGGVAENFPCGPSKVPILKRKLAQFINANVDAKTLTLKPQALDVESALAPAMNDTILSDAGTLKVPPQTVEPVPATASSPAPESAADGDLLSPEQKAALRAIPYLTNLSDDEYESLLTKGTMLTFEAGSIIMREGGSGQTFYFITQGEVEVCQRTSFEDPLTTPPAYLGSVVTTLEPGDWFGERSLITGEPRAASIRAASVDAVKAIAFSKSDFPASCILSGKNIEAAIQEAAVLNDKYGLTLTETYAMDKQILDIRKANQVRGSVNNPQIIDGVDNDNEPTQPRAVPKESKERPKEEQQRQPMPADAGWTLNADTESLVPLLVRFKLLRMVDRCFAYIMSYSPRLDELGSRRRRSMLLGLLPPSTRSDFKDAFDLIDTDGDREITLMELRRSLESVGEEKTDLELMQLIQRAGSGAGIGGTMDGKEVITEENFMGLMAEADFYNLFLDTFKALDTRDSGFVKASELDRVLCGVRDLISDDRNSIIDVEDKDTLIDYEQFSKMLLGRTLQ